MSQEKSLGKAVVYVKLKDGVLDPQGSTIKRALEDMGYQGIKDIRFGKMFEITFQLDEKGSVGAPFFPQRSLPLPAEWPIE